MKPVIAIVGRPNVGKSTLFNRLTRSKGAIVDDMPGVTRDRNCGNVKWDGREFTLVDTGGFVEDDEDNFAGRIRFQISQAISDADAVILVLDGKHGLTPFDSDLAKLVRGIEKRVYYAINKIDGPEQEPRLYDFYNLGVEKLLPVSAEHGYGVRDLLDKLVRDLSEFWSETETDQETDAVRIAVVGRPNVGKSSLINRLLGEERLLVSEIPGTTRDSVDTVCQVDGKSYIFIDTAGIRRKGRVSQKIEKFSIIKALKSLDGCDVALIVIDANEGITEQDITVAGYAYEKGCGCIFLLNKWDLLEKDKNTVKKYTERVRDAAKFLAFAPVLTLSALTGLRVVKIFNTVDDVYSQYATRTGTGKVNRIIENAVFKNEPPICKGKRIKFYYATQVSTKPPSFVCFVNLPESVHFSYKRYIINQLREETGLNKTPIRVFFRERSGRKTD